MNVRPIAVGETLRRLVSKCRCALTKMKAAAFFDISCPSGSEKIAHIVCVSVLNTTERIKTSPLAS